MADDKQETTQEAPPKKSKKLLFLALALVLAGGGGAAFFLLKGSGAAPGTAGAAPVDESAGLVAMDTFLVNLNDPSGNRYMKATLRLTVSPEAKAEEVSSDELLRAKLRDRILTVLSAKSFTELVNPLGKESLRREIQVELDPMIEQGQVKDVLFSEFVVQ